MQTTLKRIALAAAFAGLFSLLVADASQAQNRRMPQRKFGLSVSLSGSSPNVQVPIWVGKKMVIAPMIGINRTSMPSNASSMNLMAGAELRAYSKVGRICPFFGGQAAFGRSSTSVGGSSASTSAITAAGIAGAEYYFHPLFGIGLKAGLQLLLPDENVTGISNQISTFTALFASIYFN